MADYNAGAGTPTTADLQNQLVALQQQLSALTTQYNNKLQNYKKNGQTVPDSVTTDYNQQQVILQDQISSLQSQIQLSMSVILPNANTVTTLDNTQILPSTINSTTLKQINLDSISSSTSSITTPKSKISGSVPSDTDTRIRLRAMAGQESQIYGTSGLLTIINPIAGGTNGLIFPYTPQISVTHATEYGTTSLVHANEDIDHYIRTPSVTISLTAKFTIQNQREGRYALAALHFFRTVSKMHFGQNDPNRGLPPPILIFSGYGDYMFDNLPVIVKSHTYSFDDHTDTVMVNAASYGLNFTNKNAPPVSSNSSGGTARLPVIFSIQAELKVQQTPNRMRTVFDLEKFRTGQLMLDSKKGTGWI